MLFFPLEMVSPITFKVLILLVLSQTMFLLNFPSCLIIVIFYQLVFWCCFPKGSPRQLVTQ